MFQLLLLGVFIVLFKDKGSRGEGLNLIRSCHFCEHYTVMGCRTGMKSCWKFNYESGNRSCRTTNYYYHDRTSDRYLFNYAKLSCEPCEAGMSQPLHDILAETFCCTDKSRCNDGSANLDTYRLLRRPTHDH
uniref:Uncharacterized protein n=1 Tax=Spermophilus dauricus TaxID=99837 RepID=A0A8C9P956_SPEDA